MRRDPSARLPISIGEQIMSKAQQVFEAIMRASGDRDFSRNSKGNYNNVNVQTKWKYFQLGWEMRGAQ